MIYDFGAKVKARAGSGNIFRYFDEPERIFL